MAVKMAFHWVARRDRRLDDWMVEQMAVSMAAKMVVQMALQWAAEMAVQLVAD
jgi:hypothetical protein